jgi:hypothetical protein
MLNYDLNKCRINFHFSYFMLENISGKCCWKVSRDIIILTSNTDTDSTSLSEETSDLNTSSTSIITYSTIFKPIDVINLKG